VLLVEDGGRHPEHQLHHSASREKPSGGY
jgi:hypothetical protein